MCVLGFLLIFFCCCGVFRFRVLFWFLFSLGFFFCLFGLGAVCLLVFWLFVCYPGRRMILNDLHKCTEEANTGKKKKIPTCKVLPKLCPARVCRKKQREGAAGALRCCSLSKTWGKTLSWWRTETLQNSGSQPEASRAAFKNSNC